MKIPRSQSLARRVATLLALLVAGNLAGQVAPNAGGAASAPASGGERAVVLNPFEVNTSKDTSYGALNSRSIGAFNMQLLKTPVAADIFTEEFMRDVATTSVEDLLNGYGAGVGQIFPAPDSNANDNQPGDRAGIGSFGSRGVTAGAMRRNGFVASATNANANDTFDMERVEVIKGANALLFGASGAGGFVNTSSKLAQFGSDGRPLTKIILTSRMDQYGTKRWQVDLNYGLKHLAFRFVVMDEEQSYRRLFIGAKTKAYYGTVAAKLPFNTTLRLTGRRTDNDRITNTSVNDLSFTNATRDPRHNYALPYLLATNQAGAINPNTGVAYPAGAIANGNLSWNNSASWGGRAQQEDITGENYTLSVDSVWTKWLATSVGAMYDRAVSWRGVGVTALLAPRAFNTSNPYDEWANGSSFAVNRDNDANAGRRIGYRANAVVTNDLFGNRAKSQTVFGYDLNFGPGTGGGQINYRYYEADGNFNVFDSTNPRPAALGGATGANALGRVANPTFYWPVGGGPVKSPYFRMGTRRISVAGRNYVLLQQNPRNPNWETPLNPLGLLTLVPGYASIGGANLGHGANMSKNWGVYGANYSRWLDDRFTTLFGYRYARSFTRAPNTSTAGTVGWVDDNRQSGSYNLGLNYRIKPWLYAYFNAGRTFTPPTRPGDFIGNPPKDVIGFSREIGFKYEPAGARISGSISYYAANSRNETFNSYSSYANVVNPVGINDGFNQPLRNVWVNLDKESSGLEVILTAAPTKGWRARLGFTQQAGKIRSDTSYQMLWNDEFHYNKATGGVTYSDGTPFTVPTDAAGIAALSTTTALRAPIIGATNAPLTVAMMNDRNSPYYAYGQGGNTTVSGQIAGNSVLFRALRWFQIPSGGQNIQARTLRTGLPLSEIPYAYNDPAGLKGLVVLTTAGEPTVGHPLYRFVLTNTYDFQEGWLRGTTLGGTVRWDLEKRAYWFTEPNGTGGNIRRLYQEVNVNPQVSPFLAY
ncbi:MAG: TonB-dependent receptor, partial [Chthoniobacteraceae bacterium]